MALQIENYVSDLLYSADCVIIPGLGGFVANTRGAFLNPAQHTFSPPSKRIAFNAGLRTNDGLLANHISNELDITYPEAVQEIQAFVDETLKTLNSGERKVFEKIGTLSYDSERNLQFEPDSSVNYLMDSFGLTTIHSPAIRREEGQSTVRNIKSAKATQVKEKGSLWRVLELVPAAAILMLLAFNPAVIKNLNASLSSIVPIGADRNVIVMDTVSNADKKEAYPETKFEEAPIVDSLQTAIEMGDSFPPATAIDSENTSDENVSNSENKPEAVEPAPPVSTKVVVNSKVVEDKKTEVGNYYVIGGCFAVYDNAVKFVADAKAKGYDAAIIGTNNKGLNMVSLFSSNSSSATKTEMTQIKTDFQESAWMYKKKN